MRTGSTRPAALALTAWSLLVLAGMDAGAQDAGVFSAVDPDVARDARPWTEKAWTPAPRTIRSRAVRIDLAMLAAARAAADGARGPATLTLNLFEDAVFRARVEQSTPTRAGYALTGRLGGAPFGTMALVVNGPVVAGTVRTPAATWQIRSAGAGLHVIREVDLSTLPPGAEPLAPAPDEPPVPSGAGAGPFVIRQVDSSTRPPRAEPLIPEAHDRRVPPAVDGTRWGPRPPGTPSPPAPRSGDAAPADDDVSADDGSVIDVLVVYTPASREAEGGKAQIEALIDLWVAETNQAYADSGVMQRIALVWQEEVDYVETGDGEWDHARLGDPQDRYMDDVHELRDAYAADIVHLVFREAENICGVAWLILNPEHRFENLAFSASGLYCTAYAFAHELGHVMGLRHDRYVQWDVELPYPYSAGYVNQRTFDAGAPESSRWRTVMAYNRQCRDAGFDCEPLLRFSNPDQTYRGDRLGVPGDSPTTAVDGPADARRSLDETRSIVAGFRSSRDRTSCRPVLRPERQLVPAEGGTFEVSVTIHHDCAWVPTSEAAFVSLTGGGGVGSGVVTYEVAANEARGRSGPVSVSGRSLLVEQVGPVNEGICDRTPVVQQALVRAAGVEHCWDVTSAHLSDVADLRFYGRHVTALSTGDFAGLSGLRTLWLFGNDLPTLPAGLFAGLSSLEGLVLVGNGLTALPEDLFQGLSSLTVLDLGFNDLPTLPAGLFAGLSRLQRLYVGNNDLTTLPGNLFAELSVLRNLSLPFNHLTTLPGGIFAGLSNLQSLILKDNALTSLPEEVFTGLSGLQALWLGGNDLTALPAGLFADLSRLEGLIIQSNDLTALPAGLFAGLDRLELLWMGGNALTALPEGTFSGLSGLETSAWAATRCALCRSRSSRVCPGCASCFWARWACASCRRASSRI